MREAPWAVIGDFNGDGVDDVVIDGYTATKELRIVVLSRSGGSQLLTLEAGARTPGHVMKCYSSWHQERWARTFLMTAR